MGFTDMQTQYVQPAVPRAPASPVAEAPADDVLPVIRSGDLMTHLSPEERREYFDVMSTAEPYQIPPEAVYGTNGWQRALEETGADPALARRGFSRMMADMDPEDRRDLMYGNALARCYMYGLPMDLDRADKAGLAAVASVATGGNPTPEMEMLCMDTDAAASVLAGTIGRRFGM